MNKKLLLKYILMYIPFVVGIIMFSSGMVNLLSSLLVFVGGYISLKNTFDYRIVKRNIKKYQLEENKVDNNYKKDREVVNTLGIKRIKRNIRVRKREKK